MSRLVVDTNVLLTDPDSLESLAKRGRVVVPLGVVAELDKHKTSPGEVGRNARAASRIIEDLCASGDLDVQPNQWGGGTVDQEVVCCAKSFDATVVSNDTNVRILARAHGLEAEGWDGAKCTDVDPDLSGVLEVDVSPSIIDGFYAAHEVALDFSGVAPHPNEFLIMSDGSRSAIARWDGAGMARAVHEFKRDGVFGIRSKNKEQSFALDLLMDDSVKLVCLLGQAGTGKTLLAVAAGLHKTLEDGTYDRVLVSRPVMEMGKGVGYLPGTLEEKMGVWMSPIYDSIELLLNLDKAEKKRGRSATELFDNGTMKVEALTFIRGRSIPRQFMIVDEAQNLTAHELKTIISRASEGTKIVLTGDPEQIDHPKLDSESNGLSCVVRAFSGQKIAGHVALQKGERSELARLAAELM